MSLNDSEKLRIYGRNELLLIGKSVISAPIRLRVSSPTWNIIQQLGINQFKYTKRRKKGGKKKKNNSNKSNKLTGATLNCRSVCNRAIAVHDYVIEKAKLVSLSSVAIGLNSRRGVNSVGN